MSLKSRIEALILQISNAKTSLRSALSNKGVSVPISPTWDQITQGINDIEFPVMPEASLSFSEIYSAYLGGAHQRDAESGGAQLWQHEQGYHLGNCCHRYSSPSGVL